MLKQKHIWSGFITLILLLVVPQSVVANTPDTQSEPSSKFLKIEQPLFLKIGMTLGGFTLIGVELWWFLFSKTKPKTAQTTQGVQELEITVDGGYEPNYLVVQANQPVRLNFFRKDPSSCLAKVLLPDFHKAVDLSVNQTTSVEFTPKNPGTYTFHCGMNMFRGVVEVQATEMKINHQNSLLEADS